jgi:hypothetical protein
MCYRDRENMNRDDFEEGYEDDNTGGKVRVSRYSDGTTTVHHGGPCGDSHYDENGEEC